MIRVENVTVRFGETIALPPTSFDVTEGKPEMRALYEEIKALSGKIQ